LAACDGGPEPPDLLAFVRLRPARSKFAPAEFDKLMRRFIMPEPAYVIKWLEETGWFVLLALSALLFETLANLSKVDDWKTWALALGVGALRVIGAVGLNQLKKLTGGSPSG
jgi:hypothetical protein